MANVFNYRISSIRRCGYFFWVLVFVWQLFEGGYYSRVAFFFFEKRSDINNTWIKYIQVSRWQSLDTVSSMHGPQFCFQLWKPTRTTRTTLASMLWLSSESIPTCAHAAYTSCGYYLRVVFIPLRASDCWATIWGWRLSKGNTVDLMHQKKDLRQPKLKRKLNLT